MAEIKQIAIAAANWWTSKLANPTINNFRTGNNTTTDQLISLAGLSHARSHLATKELLEYFCDTLTQRIEFELSCASEIYIYCDSSPCYLLKDVATLSGIKLCLFPYHCSMWISPSSIRVKDGYGANIVRICI